MYTPQNTYSSHKTLTSPESLAAFLADQRGAAWVAFDTEFISERRYLPELCLVQVATPSSLAIIDPFTCGDLKPFWQFICDGEREVIVHAGRSEMEFCHRAVGKIPPNVIDVQLAAGLITNEYPAAFGTLVKRFLDVRLSKDETRTDWSRRPFTPQQIRYALDDVRYLPDLASRLRKLLVRQKRLAWFAEESRTACDKWIGALTGETWRGVARCGTLPPKALAIVRSLWSFRDTWGRQTNHPAQQILRDDVIVELAQRGSADATKIASLRGVPSGARLRDGIVDAIADALSLSQSEWPQPLRRTSYPQYASAIAFLHTVLGIICRRESIAPTIAATTSDLREWVAHAHNTLPRDIVPRLAHGWRRDVIAPLLEGVLHGRLVLRLKPSHDDSEMVEIVSAERFEIAESKSEREA
ncbi:MAG: ribonuclease D [Thermoguttaceae bacterium]